MKKSVLMFSLLSGTALMFPKLTIASGLPAHTLTYTPEPKPAFQFEQPDKAFKTAAVCFLGAENCGDAGFGSMGGDDGYKVDTEAQCKNEGFVSFVARFREHNKNGAIIERSRFLKENGQWYYIEGTRPIIGRNDPCPCGSGKKFKKCCGQ